MGTRRFRMAVFSASGIGTCFVLDSSEGSHPFVMRFLRYTTDDNLMPLSCSCSRMFKRASEKPGLCSAYSPC